MQSLTEIPKALGISDDAIKSALVTTFSDPSANNPFADMVNDADVCDSVVAAFFVLMSLHSTTTSTCSLLWSMETWSNQCQDDHRLILGS